MNITQQMIIISLLLICTLVNLAIKKIDIKRVYLISVGLYFSVILLNIPLMINYSSSTNVEYDPIMMSCHIKKYTNNKLISLLIIIVPLVFIEIYAVYILYIGSKYLKNFPEKSTQKLINELRLYPLIIFLCFSIKILKHILIFNDVNISNFLIILDNRGLSCLGMIMSFIYFWKFHEFDIQSFLKPRTTFAEPTEKELNQFNYIN